MTFKTIWQPVPSWEIAQKRLLPNKLPIKQEVPKRQRNIGTKRPNVLRKWIFEDV